MVSQFCLHFLIFALCCLSRCSSKPFKGNSIRLQLHKLHLLFGHGFPLKKCFQEGFPVKEVFSMHLSMKIINFNKNSRIQLKRSCQLLLKFTVLGMITIRGIMERVDVLLIFLRFCMIILWCLITNSRLFSTQVLHLLCELPNYYSNLSQLLRLGRP